MNKYLISLRHIDIPVYFWSCCNKEVVWHIRYHYWITRKVTVVAKNSAFQVICSFYASVSWNIIKVLSEYISQYSGAGGHRDVRASVSTNRITLFLAIDQWQAGKQSKRRPVTRRARAPSLSTTIAVVTTRPTAPPRPPPSVPQSSTQLCITNYSL